MAIYCDGKLIAGGSGVSSFNGRKGEVIPQDGDYTADMVGALSINGGTINGNLDIQNGNIRINGEIISTAKYVDDSIAKAIDDSWSAAY